MSASNTEVARAFDEIADLLEIQNENTFRIRAYRNAAQLVEGLGTSMADMLAKGEDLTELPGIGKDLAGKIREIVETGTCAALEEQRRKLPSTITMLLRIPGLGPKRVQALHRNLDIGTPEQLYAAVRDGKVRELPGFGEKTEATIREFLATHEPVAQRLPLAVAAQYAEPLRDYLAHAPGVGEVVIAGSYRRARESIGDLDVVVTAKKSEAVMNHFCEYPEVAEVKSRGDTRATVLLKGGFQVDLRVVSPPSFGAALYYFTGSKAHNVAVRRIAQQHGLKINEYGVYRGKRKIAGDTEESVFASVGLAFIPPELRENRGEIEAAQHEQLPSLVSLSDVKGDFDVRVHPNDGALTAIVAQARRRGWEYLVLTVRAREVTPEQVASWAATVDGWNDTHRGFTLLKGVAVDITENGDLRTESLDLSDFELVIAGLNDGVGLSRAKQTQRVLRALENPRVSMLAHPAGRRVNDKPAYDIDLPPVIRAAASRQCLLELDARPDHLDLPDVYCRMAKEEGAAVAVTSHARQVNDLEHLAYGLGQARRGWLEPPDIANTRSLKDVRAFLRTGNR